MCCGHCGKEIDHSGRSHVVGMIDYRNRVFRSGKSDLLRLGHRIAYQCDVQRAR